MKTTLFTSFSLALLFFTTIAMGQRVREVSGDPGIVNNVKKLNIVYDYSNMEVGKKSEKEYVNEKKDAYNSKEPGRGDKWAQPWVDDRQNRFEPRFEEVFNSVGDKIVGKFPSEKYTIILKTTFTEPGFNIGVMRKNAYIDVEAWIVETADQSKVIAKLSVENCPGRTAFGTDFDNGLRLQESYAMAGKALGKYFR